jgi:hypothetical protein
VELSCRERSLGNTLKSALRNGTVATPVSSRLRRCYTTSCLTAFPRTLDLRVLWRLRKSQSPLGKPIPTSFPQSPKPVMQLSADDRIASLERELFQLRGRKVEPQVRTRAQHEAERRQRQERSASPADREPSVEIEEGPVRPAKKKVMQPEVVIPVQRNKAAQPSQSDRQMFRSPNRQYILSRKHVMRHMQFLRIATSAHHQSPQLRRKPNQPTALYHPSMMERLPQMSMIAQWKLRSP